MLQVTVAEVLSLLRPAVPERRIRPPCEDADLDRLTICQEMYRENIV